MLCRLVYEKFGKDALPLIEEACYKLGVADGEKDRRDSGSVSFKEFQEVLLGYMTKEGIPFELIELSDTKTHRKSYMHMRCPLGLTNTSHELCESMMALDKGRIEAAIEKKVKLDILKTVASGDPYCETIWTVIE